ncbi:MAG: hypothetical protein ACX930_12410 [Erythrobacter sp.]
MRHWPWDVLGIDPTRDDSAVRKAYAEALRQLDLDKDVQAYSDLRGARDEGLWLARNGDAKDDGDFGLGSLDDPPEDDPGFDVTSVRFSETGNTVGVQDDGLDWGGLHPHDAGTGGFDASPPDVPPEPELTEGQERARAAWTALLDILYPDGQYSDEAITLDQLGEGNRHLQTLIERADECEIDEHHALDHGLAQLLAETWPRSAPFVEPSADAFHWLDESGQLEERPALMFLNLRLRGMRFHEKVQRPEHPLNKAWVELSKPGKARWIDRMRVKNDDVYQLLAGIRERYPEVESYLDWERVASWENPTESDGGGGLPWWVGIIIVVAVFRIASGLGSNDSEPPPAMPVQMAEPQVIDDSEFAARISALFGEDVGLQDVREIDPVFGDQLRNAMQTERDGYSSIEIFVRSQAYRSASIAEFEELVVLGELKRLWMAQAIDSPDQCRNVMAGDFNSLPLELGRAETMREARLLRRLLDAGVMSHLGGREGGTFSVPGWAVEETITRSGLGEAQVSAALRDPDHASRCQVEMTLLDVVLKEPGRVSADLLRGL